MPEREEKARRRPGTGGETVKIPAYHIDAFAGRSSPEIPPWSARAVRYAEGFLSV